MAIRQGRKVTELTALNSASLNTYVVGVDNNVTYKISLDVLEDAVVKIVSSSTDARLDAIEAYTASFTSSLTDISNLNTFTSSYYTDSASFSNRIDAATNEQNLDNLVLTASFNEFTESSNSRLDNLEQSTSSFYTEDNSYPQDINFLAQFTDTKKLGKAPIYITGSNIIVSGSMEVSGSVIFLGNQFISGTIELYDVTGESDHVILFQQDRDGTLSVSNGRFVPADGIRIPGGQNQIILKNDADTQYDTNIQNIDGVGMQISSSGTNDAILEIVGHSLNLQNTFTASLSEGYIWAGNSNNKTYEIPTASFEIKGSGIISASSQISESGFVSSSTINNIETITSASYAAITPVSGTLYIIID